jgi:hypothetical protein
LFKSNSHEAHKPVVCAAPAPSKKCPHTAPFHASRPQKVKIFRKMTYSCGHKHEKQAAQAAQIGLHCGNACGLQTQGQ